MGGKVGVFPASGGLGSSTVNHLTKLYKASELVLIARSPERLTDLSQAGAVVRHADYDEPATLQNAFDGIETLFLISYASFEIEHRVVAHRRAIDAAIKSGVKYIFYSSLAFAGDSDHSVAHVMGAHLATEKYLAEQSHSVGWTAIREGIYSESFPIYTAWFDPSNPADEITIPHSGAEPGVAWVKRDELGGGHSEADSLLYARPNGIQIGDKHTYHGKDLSREWSTAWEAIQNGETAVVAPDIVEILGREPEPYETTIKALIG
ncbi:hypothetical protein N7468_010071 [Penicillium chermesinum]|uniref:NAD(P)-binding domain-containing protein n=1 Tax=Penicillium chermesinum TaxID=63820 RepID=A0A9W9NC11_9EURO|nr:uncharacterized protein N7468_010071 [Penicillium chermesinum]KAJ5217063.1 hypothetical protein N7468_010071 [Penicillium chermesinum]